jgi:8-oxo-dGTP diphosphatase
MMKKYEYKYPRPSVTVDLVIIRGGKDLLLIKRAKDPFKDCWALAGGFVDENEGLEEAARRELKEETCLEVGVLQQVGAFGKPGRDPRGHTISIAYLGLVEPGVMAVAADDAAEVDWFPIEQLPALAFDHEEIIAQAKNFMK